MMSQHFHFIFLLLSTVILNTTGQGLMKLGSGQNLLNISILGGLTAYALSTGFYLLILSKTNLSVAYPLVIGLTIAATTFVGAIFFKEQVTTLHWLGIGLMLSGISALAR